jgi:hypothetical protein
MRRAWLIRLVVVAAFGRQWPRRLLLVAQRLEPRRVDGVSGDGPGAAPGLAGVPLRPGEGRRLGGRSTRRDTAGRGRAAGPVDVSQIPRDGGGRLRRTDGLRRGPELLLDADLLRQAVRRSVPRDARAVAGCRRCPAPPRSEPRVHHCGVANAAEPDRAPDRGGSTGLHEASTCGGGRPS